MMQDIQIPYQTYPIKINPTETMIINSETIKTEKAWMMTDTIKIIIETTEKIKILKIERKESQSQNTEKIETEDKINSDRNQEIEGKIHKKRMMTHFPTRKTFL